MTVPALTLVMTAAGLARFTAAQLDGGPRLAVARIGLTDTAFVLAPTLTALPGEFRRIDTLSGKAVGDNVVHLILRDDEPLTYGVRGIGLFLDDGTLLAVYGQTDRIVEKSVASSLLLALDLAFPAANVAQVTFGDTNFIDPPATTTTKGIVELATDAETLAGTDTSRAVTPKGLAARVADVVSSLIAEIAKAVADYVPLTQKGQANGVATLGANGKVPDVQLPAPPAAVAPTRKITVAGLAKGGGTLEADREIAVDAATAAEVLAGARTDKAVTPGALKDAGARYVVDQGAANGGGYRKWSDGTIECEGVTALPANATTTILLPIAYASYVVPVGSGSRPTDESANVGVVAAQLDRFTVKNPHAQQVTFFWQARGR